MGHRRSALALALALLVATLVWAGPGSAGAAGTRSKDVGADEEKLRSRGDIVIDSNDDFTHENGVISGKGTKDKPFVISNWSLPTLIIRNTSSWVTIRNNDIAGQLVLDWIGHGTRVHHNNIGDLRVNQNVERTGMMTGGVISNNQFRVVGQLRHWDGIFEDNIVGTKDVLFRTPNFRAVNFDGFNGSHFRHNTIFGYVDVRLHGHHHGSGFGGSSHDHAGEYEADPEHAGHHGMGPDHTKRWHEVFFYANEIHSDYSWALRYTDTDHTANDRTAASETNKLLNCPHVHHTKVHFTNNDLIGSGLLVDVFNATDDNHWGTTTGVVELANNNIKLERDARELLGGRYGIVVQQAVDLKLNIKNNQILGPNMVGEDVDLLKLEKKLNKGAGILLQNLDYAKVKLLGNEVASRMYGVQATQMTEHVRWLIKNLKTIDVDEDVHYDESVARRPKKKG